MEAHRADAVCAGCHKVMDPIGFALENFDAIGQWRASDDGAKIDPSGTFSSTARTWMEPWDCGRCSPAARKYSWA